MATTEQWRRFVANAPEAQREYRTLEIWHPQFATVRRFVSNYCDLTATLEAGAPRDPGRAVVFTGATLSITEPVERQDAEQSLAVEFGNVDGVVSELVDQIAGLGYLTGVDVVYRKYYSGDLTTPAVPPLYLFAASLAFSGPLSVAFSAEDVDLSQKRAGRLYTPADFPGLQE